MSYSHCGRHSDHKKKICASDADWLIPPSVKQGKYREGQQEARGLG